MITKIRHYLFFLFLFLLPWQTRYMYVLDWKNGQPFEYATLSIYATELLLGSVLFLLIIELLRSEDFRARLKQRAHTSILFSILIIILPIIFFWRHSIFPQISWQYLNWILYGACAGIIIFWQKNKVKDFIYALWLSGIVQGALAVWQFFTQNIFANKWLGLATHSPSDLGASVLLAQGERWLRAYGSFPWPNALGIYLAVIVVLGGVIYLQTHCHSERSEESLKPNRRDLSLTLKMTAEKYFYYLFWPAQLLIFSGLILSFSRAAYLGAIVGLVILFWQNKNKPFSPIGGWSKKITEFLIPQIILIVIFFILLFPLFAGRATANNYLETRAINERFAQLGEFKKIFSQNILFGVGPGAYGTALAQTYPEKQVWQLQPVHNIYLLFLAEWGIVGAAFLFVLLYKFFKSRLFISFNWVPVAVLFVAGLFDHWSLSSFTGMVFLCIIFSFGGIDTERDMA